ncbi:MAG: divalent-cation tolerance protein CutA [Xenococcaceae cyanobacterium MO_167.B27]|nr:divalent-cation tolerance protein CutA [Xenococcaceae cyanobacterium MO_167.B27]
MDIKADCLWVYCTTDSMEEAPRISKILVEAKLAACVNLIPEIYSIYQWQGKIEESQEIALIAKTTTHCLESLKRTIIEHHSYECPCIVALPMIDGNQEFLQWIRSQTNYLGNGMLDP